MTVHDPRLIEMCDALYAGGWRKEDRDLLIETYDEVTPGMADLICEILAEMEE